MRMIKVKVPRRYRDFEVLPMHMPEHPTWNLIYDMSGKIVWVNTAAANFTDIARVLMK